MTKKEFARNCTECGAGMNEGYCFDGGRAYYCSDACLHKHFTHDEWEKLYNDGDGDSCWTTWDEDPDEYMVDEDDMEQVIGFDGKTVAKIFAVNDKFCITFTDNTELVIKEWTGQGGMTWDSNLQNEEV